MNKYTQEDIDRFYNKITLRGDEINDCWDINCYKDKDGYPRVGVKGVMYPASRFMYSIWNPDEDISNKLICHKCDNPGCVNIHHLFSGTHQDNNTDRNNKNRQMRGEKHTSAILKEKDIITIFNKILNKEYTKTSQIKNDYKLHNTTILQILKGKTWRHITKDFDLKQIRELILKKNKFSDQDIINIRNDQRSYASISRDYNVTPEMISMIKRRILYKHVY